MISWAQGLIGLSALLAVCSPAIAAKPRGSVSLMSDTVKLSDLFSGLEPGQDCAIGPAPAPGRSIVIEQPQLAAIAEQFGVDWQPNSLSVQVSLKRKARTVARSRALPLIRAALIAAGASENIDVTVENGAELVVPAEFDGDPDIQLVNLDRSSGRFTADLVFAASGMDPIRLEVEGVVQEVAEVPVLVRNMEGGSVIEASDLQTRRLRKALVGDQTLLSASNAVGLALRHRWFAGNPIPLTELTHPLLISRAMPVLLRLENAGLVLTAKGEAIEGGALGDRIHVLNPVSRAVLTARVTGPGTVDVDTTSLPVILSQQQAGLPQPYGLTALSAPSDPGWIQ